MMRNCIGMLLAGGEGRRLGLLTDYQAKPAVPFGGKYRIIDFTLSNCVNSGIKHVGVMTQYSPLELNEHIGNGEAWDLNTPDTSLAVLPPYIAQDGGDWFAGTADAIYQNMHYINQRNPEHVLVISGDHIYHMDYSEMLAKHQAEEADATISVLPVEWEEASRFGILNTEENMRIYEFDEKPEEPKSNLASMGIYIFSWDKLKYYLEKDAQDQTSSHDFGKDVIPRMLNDNCRMFAYRFEGYWKDVGTVESYWEANMDLLNEGVHFSLNNQHNRVYTQESNVSPEYIGETGEVINALIDGGCFIYGKVYQSIVSENVMVGEDSVVQESIIHKNVTIGKNVRIERAIVMEGTTIPDGFTLAEQENKEPIVLNQATIQETSTS